MFNNCTYFIIDSLTKNFDIYISKFPGFKDGFCARQTGSMPAGNAESGTIKYMCAQHLIGSFVSVYQFVGGTTFGFCDVQVYADVKIKRGFFSIVRYAGVFILILYFKITLFSN